ncbi:MAG: DUF1449 family protein [Armatimonadetes bacterium]|nr:DUF1449 family protein [Armatimonadota bacterium]
MLTFYIIATILGGGLVLLSALGGIGGGHFDMDHDMSVDVNTDVDMDHDVSHDGDTVSTDHFDFWLPFFSLRFWTYAFAAFGVFGLFLTFTKFAPEPMAAMISAGAGVLIGSLAAIAMRWINKSSVNSVVRESDFIGQEGKMSVTPRNGEPGKVRLEIKGEMIDMLAMPAEGFSVQQGEEVIVVGVDGTRVRVAKASDYLEQ